jgi:hypothetical protein
VHVERNQIPSRWISFLKFQTLLLRMTMLNAGGDGSAEGFVERSTGMPESNMKNSCFFISGLFPDFRQRLYKERRFMLLMEVRQ